MDGWIEWATKQTLRDRFEILEFNYVTFFIFFFLFRNDKDNHRKWNSPLNHASPLTMLGTHQIIPDNSLSFIFKWLATWLSHECQPASGGIGGALDTYLHRWGCVFTIREMEAGKEKLLYLSWQKSSNIFSFHLPFLSLSCLLVLSPPFHWFPESVECFSSQYL